jgi:hypothetical protein
MGEMRKAHIFVGKPEGKRPPGRPRRRWEVNIGADLREIGWKGVNWIHLAQDMEQWRALMNTELRGQQGQLHLTFNSLNTCDISYIFVRL